MTFAASRTCSLKESPCSVINSWSGSSISELPVIPLNWACTAANAFLVVIPLPWSRTAVVIFLSNALKGVSATRVAADLALFAAFGLNTNVGTAHTADLSNELLTIAVVSAVA